MEQHQKSASISSPPQSQDVARVTVWDGWVRLFHWTLVALLGLAWWSADTGRLEFHRLCGYGVLGLVIFRIFWGFFGSESARFARFLQGPAACLAHLRHVARREPDREPTHNAVGGWMVVVLLALLLVQTGTGLFANDQVLVEGPLAHWVSGNTSDWLTHIHHLNFTLLEIAVVLHVVAVLAYGVLKRQDLLRPMLLGWKRLPAPLAPRIAPFLHGALYLLLAAALVLAVVYGAGPRD